MLLWRSFEVWARQIFSGRLSDRDGLVGHYVKGRDCQAPRLLPAQCLGAGRKGEGQAEAEVGTRRVPVFTGRVSIPFMPGAAGALPVQPRLQVWGRRVAGHGEHA